MRDRMGRFAFPLVLITAYLATLAVSHGIITLILTEPSELVRNAVSAVSGIIVFSGIIMAFAHIMGRRHREDFHKSRRAVYKALGQISKGNFDIQLDTSESDKFFNLAQAVSDMAKSLGELENMRIDFISNVSHEIQSPLTSISGFAALLQDKNLPEEERMSYAKIIEVESKRLSSLADNLLKLSTLDTNKAPLTKKDFKLDKQLEHAALMLEPQWTAKNISVEAELQNFTYRGDEDLLSQVWTNLLHNAIKFTPEGGRIELSLQSEGSTAVVKVTDNGMGIAPEDQIRIFERFYKVDKARDRALGGNGLGLSLVKRIVEMHSGNIEMDSEVDKGTVFTVRLT